MLLREEFYTGRDFGNHPGLSNLASLTSWNTWQKSTHFFRDSLKNSMTKIPYAARLL